MTKDNITGKDKEFYDLGKKMFDHIERAQQQRVEDSIRRAAQESALNFISESDAIELGMMTLRRAYETGYRAGMYAEQRKKDE